MGGREDRVIAKVLVLGAGFVAPPLVRYLLGQGYELTVADLFVEKAEALVAGHDKGRAVEWSNNRADQLGELVAAHDLTVSLLPASMHPTVAKACLRAGKHMVSSSYVSPEMMELDGDARDRGLLLLNEIGVDPGIDHMSIVKVVDHVRSKGGELTLLRSNCGGLPAPDANDNPVGYKFSWSPAGVLVAMTGPALFREDGKEVEVPPGGLFDQVRPVTVDGLGELEYYPNRDSLSYIDVYGLDGIDTIFRGTFRYPGWASLWKALGKVGLLDRTARGGLEGRTFGQVLGELVGAEPGPDLRAAVAAKAGVAADDRTMDQAEWIGLLSDRKLGGEGTILDCVATLLTERMAYAEGERDMLLMKHDFVASYPKTGETESITSTMLAYGEPGGDSAMARTVGLPAAIGARLVLEGKIAARGVRRPVIREIYEPVLAELETLGIELKETYQTSR